MFDKIQFKIRQGIKDAERNVRDEEIKKKLENLKNLNLYVNSTYCDNDTTGIYK